MGDTAKAPDKKKRSRFYKGEGEKSRVKQQATRKKGEEDTKRTSSHSEGITQGAGLYSEWRKRGRRRGDQAPPTWRGGGRPPLQEDSDGGWSDEEEEPPQSWGDDGNRLEGGGSSPTLIPDTPGTFTVQEGLHVLSVNHRRARSRDTPEEKELHGGLTQCDQGGYLHGSGKRHD